MKTATLIMMIALLGGCQRESDVPHAAATPPDQTPTGPATETMAPPVTTDPTSAPATTPGTETVPRIALQDAVQQLQTGQAVLVDVRSEDAYKAQHAQGAIHVPEDQVLNRIADLPIGKRVITYCT